MTRTGFMVGALWALTALGGCPVEQIDENAQDCSAICDEVVRSCQLDGWSSWEDCVGSCITSGDQGADLVAQRQCTDLAACDVFALVECENDFGPR